jgi:hypothetical protein
MPNTMIGIVPNFPPSIDGIGDYALNLAQQLHQDYGWNTRFIVGTPDWTGENFFEAESVKSRSREALISLLPSPSETILLHYAGHGYADRGCPVWLVQALAQWCKQGGKLVTMFHELYATKPLLSSAILTSPFQKRLAIQLMQISDRVLTSRLDYANKISALSQHQSVTTLPIFSNLGEIEHPKPLNRRSRELVIFGNTSSRQQIYQQLPFLTRICQSLEIQHIVDVGAKIDLKFDTIDQVSIQMLGIQTAEQISQTLSHAIAGVTFYPPAYLAKSGVFAAYCSHGVLPIVLSNDLLAQDGLILNQHYWNAKDQIDLNHAQAIATAAHTWYQSHSLSVHAQQFDRSLNRLDFIEYLCSR